MSTDLSRGDSAPDQNHSKLSKVLSELNIYRGHLLTAAEFYFQNSAHWPSIRHRFLSLLGDKGLGGAIQKIFETDCPPETPSRVGKEE